MLQLRNTPDPGCSISPAQILFGRPLRDAFSFVNRVVKFHNPAINRLWRKTWEAKEVALRTKFVKSVENLNAHSHPLPKLGIGDDMFVQNQTGPHPNKWDCSGLVVEAKDHDQYLIKMDDTGRLTLRNRRFLRLYMLPDTAHQQPGTSHIMPDMYAASEAVGMSKSFVPASQKSMELNLNPGVPSSPQDNDFPTSEVVPPETEEIGNTTMSKETMHTTASQPEPSPRQSFPTHQCCLMRHVLSKEDVINNLADRRPKRIRQSPKQYIPETGQWSR